MLLKAILVSLLFIFAACTEPTQEDYNESLTFERLSNGDLLYVMEFKNSFNDPADIGRYFQASIVCATSSV